MLTIADNLGNVVAPFVVKPVNIHDTKLFDESFTNLLETADLLNLDIDESYFTLDSGFDSLFNNTIISEARLIPIIKFNLRGLKDREKIERIFNDFETIEFIYKERYKIERCFAWEDTYRKLVIRYERLQSTFMGFRYLAYSMINFRWFFGKKGEKL